VTSAAYWVCAGVTALNAFISLFFSTRAVLTSSGMAQTNALYAAARALPLAAVSLVPFVHHSRAWLIALATILTAVQALDALIGIRIRDRKETWGPACTAALNLAALVWLVS
jgi:hypothetical protein